MTVATKKPLAVRRILKGAAVFITTLSVIGCTVGPAYEPPEVVIPDAFRAQRTADANSIADLPWWNVFQDPVLQELITQGLRNNYDLTIAVARIEQARALVGVVRSESMPQIGYEGSGGYDRFVAPQEEAIDAIDYTTFSGGLNAAWELDVWGRIRHSTDAALANMLAQEEVRRAVILTLVGDLATNYFQLLSLDSELAIAQESSDTYKGMRSFFSDRSKAGKDSDLPVQRASAAYNASIADIATLKRRIAQQENAISLLVGSYPTDVRRGYPLKDQFLPQTPVGTTTDLLKRRPDILQAEQVMIGANAEIGVAVANYYPRIGLSALLGGEAAEVTGSFESFGIGNIFANLTGPIFTGDRLESIYEERQAFWDEAVAQYKKTVLTAFKETSDALAAQEHLVQQREALFNQVGSLQRSAELALLRYRSGRSSYFEILEAQQQLFPAETALAQTQRDQLIAVIDLYKALGGGWKLPEPAAGGAPQLPPPPAPENASQLPKNLPFQYAPSVKGE